MRPSPAAPPRRVALSALAAVVLATVSFEGVSIGIAGVHPAAAVGEVDDPSAEPSASEPSASAEPSASTEPPPSAEPSGSIEPSPAIEPTEAPTPTPAPSGSIAPTLSPTMPAPTATPAQPAPTPTPSPPGPLPLPGSYPAQCVGWSPARERADLLLRNVYRINSHPAVTLPANPKWNENPLHDANWEYQFHSQWLTLALFQSYHETGDPRYVDRAAFLLQDWWTENPRKAPRSPLAWDRMGTALRAQVLACAWRYLPHASWLVAMIDAHGAVLADPALYAKEGNHALNQNLGLLELGVVRKRSDWTTLARTRLATLWSQSVDSQGVTNEQSIWYQFYNWDRYRIVFDRLTALGYPLPTTASRLALMPRFLAYATLPNGEYEMIGDVDRIPARTIPGTWAQFAATKGVVGPQPPDTVAVYRAGYLFARSGWGTTRPIEDEVALSLRWGPAPIIHGHRDAGSVTLYGFGSRLLIDPGKYTYNQDAYRTYFKGRSAHNVVTVDGVAYAAGASSTLVDHRRDATMVAAQVKITGNPGVTHLRSVVFSRGLNYTLVEDRLTSSTTRTYRQLWHLPDGAQPELTSTSFRTRRSGANVQVRQLIGGTTSRVVSGRTSPIQGWLAWRHGDLVEAPVVEVIRRGTTVRYLTLLVTAPGTPSSTVSSLRVTPTGYSVVIRIGSRSERVVVNGTSVTITPLG